MHGTVNATAPRHKSSGTLTYTRSRSLVEHLYQRTAQCSCLSQQGGSQPAVLCTLLFKPTMLCTIGCQGSAMPLHIPKERQHLCYCCVLPKAP